MSLRADGAMVLRSRLKSREKSETFSPHPNEGKDKISFLTDEFFLTSSCSYLTKVGRTRKLQ